jgi:hypothetical protein
MRNGSQFGRSNRTYPDLALRNRAVAELDAIPKALIIGDDPGEGQRMTAGRQEGRSG